MQKCFPETIIIYNNKTTVTRKQYKNVFPNEFQTASNIINTKENMSVQVATMLSNFTITANQIKNSQFYYKSKGEVSVELCKKKTPSCTTASGPDHVITEKYFIGFRNFLRHFVSGVVVI